MATQWLHKLEIRLEKSEELRQQYKVAMRDYLAGNRVARIQELTSQKIWRYVPSSQNPVVCASRGLTPSEIVDHPLWWNMSDTDLVENQSEEKLITLIASATTTQLDENCAILYASSELSKVLRLAAYWLRLRQRLGGPGCNTQPIAQVPKKREMHYRR